MKEINRKINPKHISALIDMVNSSPYFSLLGIKIKVLESGYAKVEIDLENRHLNPFGSIHGGVCASLIDTAAYWAAYYDQDEDAGFTSLDLSITNLSMVNSGKLIATATAIKEGRSVCLCEATVTDEAGKIIAHGTSKLMMLHGKQSVSDAIRSMGYPELPPKFL